MKIKNIIIITVTSLILYGCPEMPPDINMLTDPDLCGIISGVVTNSANGTVVEGATITTNPETRIVTTNRNGEYTIENIPVGDYAITAAKTTFGSGLTNISVVANQTVIANIVLVSEASSYVDMIFVQGGTFQMGDTFGDGYSNELPVHSVTLSNYYISKYEITNEQYCKFLNEEGNQTEGGVTWLYEETSFCFIENVGGNYKPKIGYANYPVRCISWYGARAYCQWAGGRLPTEAEWEYAARGGSQSADYKYSGSNNIDAVAWYWDNAGKRTHEVGTKQANELGIYDMSGNVWEWCNDWFDNDYYNHCLGNNPQGPSNGSFRVLRGGFWSSDADCCRATYRLGSNPVDQYNSFGFRIVRDN